MSRRWSWSVAAACVLATVGCSGDDGGSDATTDPSRDRVTIVDLSDFTSGECPLPVYEATGFIANEPSSGSAETAPPGTVDPAADPRDVPPLQAIDGVSVQCEHAVEAGAVVHFQLVAGRTGAPGSAANVLIPRLVREAELTVDQAESIVATFPDLDLGTPADIPGDDPVALVRLSVEGAADAAVLVWSDDGPAQAEIEDVAIELDGLLR